MEDKEKKLFVNKTTYTTDTYVEFLKFHNKKYNLSYIAYTVIWIMLFIFCIIIAFGSEMRLQGVSITMILVVFIIYRILRPKMIVNREMKSEKVSDNNTNTFVFYRNQIEISNNNGKFNYKYMNFRKVFETKDFFYLYVTRENAFLVSKNTFSLGNSKDFSNFIKDKCRFKYKFCN